jgi:hypothetical protein
MNFHKSDVLIMMRLCLSRCLNLISLLLIPLSLLGCEGIIGPVPPKPVSTIQACNGTKPCFLTKKGTGSVQEAQAYYDTLDPNPATKTTLAQWFAQNGFPSPLPAESAHAVYFNNGDLQIGRDMYCRQSLPTVPTLRVACYVTNYGPAPGTPTYPDEGTALTDAVAAQNPTGVKHPFATVAMEYVGNQFSTAPPQVDFYVFDGQGQRINAAALDSEGAKAIPQMCMACHGGTYSPQTHRVTGASFLPFDVFSFHYSTTPSYTRSAQEEQFRKLNAMVKLMNTRPAIVEMIDAMYPQGVGAQGSIATDTQVPAGWTSQSNLYKNFVTPYCRGCHVASTLSFQTYQDFKNLAPTIRADVCRAHSMPHAEVPFKRIWTPALGFLLAPGVLDDPNVVPPPTGPPDAKCLS